MDYRKANGIIYAHPDNTEVLVDDFLYENFNQYGWYIDTHGYAYRRKKDNKKVKMHREVMDFPAGLVDHINGNKLDNRKENLRCVTLSENALNRHTKSAGTTSKFFGVYRTKKEGHWVARLKVDHTTHCLGNYETEEEAAVAYNIKAEELGVLTRNDVDMSIIPIRLKRRGNTVGNAKMYPGLVSPDGIIYSPINNLKVFCREHSIKYTTVHAAMQRNQTYFNGWRILVNGEAI